MRLLIVSEGWHELGGSLETIVRRLSRLQFDLEWRKVSDPALRVHGGRGPGYFKKALRCVRYAAENGFDGVVLVIDQDDQPERRRQLADAQADHRIAALPRALGVAVRTFDAWMLADERALTTVLGQTVQRQPDPEDVRDAKLVCRGLRDAAGLSLRLSDLYAGLAATIDLDVLARRCPLGFAPFAERLHQMVSELNR